MAWGNFLTITSIIFVLRMVYVVLNKKNRIGIRAKNTRLDELRSIRYKTVDEQKEFISLKYPKTGFSWSGLIWGLIIGFGQYIIMYAVIAMIFGYYHVEINFWVGVIVLFVSPILFNLIMRRFGLHADDVTVFLRG